MREIRVPDERLRHGPRSARATGPRGASSCQALILALDPRHNPSVRYLSRERGTGSRAFLERDGTVNTWRHAGRAHGGPDGQDG